MLAAGAGPPVRPRSRATVGPAAGPAARRGPAATRDGFLAPRAGPRGPRPALVHAAALAHRDGPPAMVRRLVPVPLVCLDRRRSRGHGPGQRGDPDPAAAAPHGDDERVRADALQGHAGGAAARPCHGSCDTGTECERRRRLADPQPALGGHGARSRSQPDRGVHRLGPGRQPVRPARSTERRASRIRPPGLPSPARDRPARAGRGGPEPERQPDERGLQAGPSSRGPGPWVSRRDRRHAGLVRPSTACCGTAGSLRPG